jgi:predicted NUDIX family NTP pyrophosphohydrolase
LVTIYIVYQTIFTNWGYRNFYLSSLKVALINMKVSAGLLLYKIENDCLMFFLVHPGGPFFARKDDGYWTIPKGLIEDDEQPLEAAIREFEEETGFKPEGKMKPLQPIIQKGGKKVLCWSVESDLGLENLRSNTFELAWPPKSGKIKTYPEIDKYGWFNIDEAMRKINGRQQPFLQEVFSLEN